MTIQSGFSILLATAAYALASLPASANQILDLAAQSDVIVVGKATGMSSNELNTVQFELRVDRTLKGAAPAGGTVNTTLRGLNRGAITDGRIRVPQPLPEMYGLWFLKRAEDGTFESVPRELGMYHFNSAVVRVPRHWSPLPTDPLDTVLLSAALASYRHVGLNHDWVIRGEARFAEIMLRNSLEYAGRFGGSDAALRVVDELLESGDKAERNIGLAVGLAVSYDPAIVRFTTDLESTKLLPNDLPRILPELWKYDSSTDLGAARIEGLLRWNRSAKIGGLDQALVGSLGHVSGPSRLPLVARFLDSPERGARQLAVRLFYLYSVLARNDGSVSTDGTGGTHPYYNEITKAHTGSDLTKLEEDVAFWLQWWTEHRKDIALRGNGSRRPY